MIRHYAWSAARQWGQRLGTALTFVILARILSAQQIGLFSAALAIMALAELFNENGASEAVIRHREASAGAIKALSLVNISASIMLSAGFILLGGRIEAFFGTPGLRPIVSVLSLVLLLNAFVYIPMAMLRREMRFARLARVGLTSTALGSVVGIGGAILGFGVWSLVAQALVGAAANLVQMNWRRRRSGVAADFAAAGPLFGFSGFVLIGNLLSYVSSRSVELALPYHYGAATLAIYVIGSRFYFVAAQMITAVLLDVTMTQLSRAQHEPTVFRRLLAINTQLGALAGGAVFFGLAAIAPEFCGMVFGQMGARAWPFLTVVAVAGNAMLLNYVAQVALKAHGHSRVTAAATALHALFALAILLPRWPIPALERVVLVNAVVVLPLSLQLGKLHRLGVVGTAQWMRAIVPAWVAGGSMWLVIATLRRELTGSWPNALALPVLIIGGAIVYLAISFATAGSRQRRQAWDLIVRTATRRRLLVAPG